MRRFALLIAMVCCSGFLGAQQVGDLSAPAAKPVGYVVYDSEPQVVKAGKADVIELRFKVRDGFHVNSHTPKSDLLIPTAMKLDAAAGVKAQEVVYPAGTLYSFSFDPKEKLDVYTGSFVVKVPVVAAAGEHTLTGSLHYQACDTAACYPPKTLAVQVVFSAK
jgi:Disulphide bond corrector protein DsbC